MALYAGGIATIWGVVLTVVIVVSFIVEIKGANTILGIPILTHNDWTLFLLLLAPGLVLLAIYYIFRDRSKV